MRGLIGETTIDSLEADKHIEILFQHQPLEFLQDLTKVVLIHLIAC